jgi:CDP-diacylglycerol--glycerol-3-phosphate 3-phosphatidyltransferase
MNGPNLLTLLRIFFVPLLVAALLGEDFSAPWMGQFRFSRDTFALLIFLAAAATDLLDGYLARRWGQITTVGTLLDPIADKLLISAALISLVDIHRVPAWMVILIIGREFAVSGLRSIAAAGGYMIEASELGKSKMVAQVVAIALVIAGIRWPALNEISMLAMWTVVLFALASAADYFRRFWRQVEAHVKVRRRRELLALQRQQRRAMRSGLASSAKVVE